MSPAEQARLDGGRPPYTPADVTFMQGMIGHHAQAVRMARWAPTHGAGASLQRLAERIAVSQEDEIAFMKRWLTDRDEAVPDPGDHAGHAMAADARRMPEMKMSGKDMSGEDVPAMMMPGMLTDTELTQLDDARGVEFDRLFLTYMIKHHEGALTMVRTLLSSTGSAQDDDVYKFVADVNVDQETEIAFMGQMLRALPPSAATPPSPSF